MAFRPTRSSPPAKPAPSGPSDSFLTSALDVSRSSTLSIRELVGLSSTEIEMLDAIIDRAGAATTFPAIFTAYNAVLKERGVDPSEVVYYGKLLKLGTLKGSSWAEKWRVVKTQQGYGATPAPVRAPLQPMPALRARIDGVRKAVARPTRARHDSSDDEVNSPTAQLHRPTRPLRRPPSPSDLSSLSYTTPPRRPRQLPPFSARDSDLDSESSIATRMHGGGAPSTTPPSYRAAMRDSPSKPSIVANKPAGTALVRQRLAQVRERRGSMVNHNVDDTFKRIEMEKKEQDAVRFYEDRLVERCWQVWRTGFGWIVEINDQVANARDQHVLRLCLHRWRRRTTKVQEHFHAVAKKADALFLRNAFARWKARAVEQKQVRRRTEVRGNIKHLRDKRERRILVEMFHKWRRAYTTAVVVRHREHLLLVRYFERWKQKTRQLDRLDERADEFVRARDREVLERVWFWWKQGSLMRISYRTTTESVGLRIKTQVMDVWKRRLCVLEAQTANAFHDDIIKRNVLRLWKARLRKLQISRYRAEEHNEMQLVRAAFTQFKDRYRCRKLTVLTNARRLKEAWAVWKARAGQHYQLELTAITFSRRPNALIAETTLRKWHEAYQRQRKAIRNAERCGDVLLRRRFFHLWKVRLAKQRGEAIDAAAVYRQFLLRRAMRKMRDVVLARKLETYQLVKKQQVFYRWFDRVAYRYALRDAERELTQRYVHRLLRTTLQTWLTRTVNLKDQEYHIDARRKRLTLVNAFKKWKAAKESHAEKVRLMESYLIVKREEQLRRVFMRWLTAMRKARHRRVTLEKREAEVNYRVIVGAWEKWRERARERELRPIEDVFLVQRQQALMVKVFTIWQSKTLLIPALRFDKTRVKTRAWKTWLATLPQALLGQKAKDFDRNTILSKYFARWLQVRRTKKALRDISRARYMRLPTTARAGPSQPAPVRTTAAPFSGFPRRAVRTEERASDDEGSDDEPRSRSRSRPRPAIRGPRSLRSDPSPPPSSPVIRAAAET
ncbi:CTLH domain-containing protein [Mycena kentingensis (nom. inval.)]|nr:CTLH domain-containing protein [Mycena kentingensis (nom. inval.)]